MLPAAGRPSPARRRRRLDLPLPLGPVRRSASPALSASETPLNTSRSPRRQARSRHSGRSDEDVMPALLFSVIPTGASPLGLAEWRDRVARWHRANGDAIPRLRAAPRAPRFARDDVGGEAGG